MKVLVIDVGGTNVKMLATGQQEPNQIPLRARHDCQGDDCGVKQRTRDWKYDVISVGYRGPMVATIFVLCAGSATVMI